MTFDIKPLIYGVNGFFLNQQEVEFFQANPVAGFILFNRNISSRTQVLELVKQLKSLYPERKTLIFIDQEGGRVARLKPPIVKQEYESPAYFGRIYDESGRHTAIKQVEDNYYNIMCALAELGIDSPCAPVADLRYPFADNIIGDRSFGAEVQKVTDLSQAAIQGIKKGGGIAIIKHIPGHGRATIDSHLGLPYITASLEDLYATDFKTFRQLSENKSNIWAMTAHIIYEALDASLPVTFSAKAIKFIREQIGFTGTLVSDDIGMLALHGETGTKYLAIKKTAEELEGNKEGNIGSNININHSLLIQQYNYLKPAFIESLQHATRQSLAAGCNLILHCSGDLEEMQAVAEVV